MKTRFSAPAGVLLILAIVTSACGGAGAPAGPGDHELTGTITVSGAFALYPMMTVWAAEFTKLHPEVEFDVQGGGAGKGMTDTLAGAVDIGMISRTIRAEEEAQGAFWVSVAKDAVFPIVSADNPYLPQISARGLSADAFGKIFISGQIKTWGEAVGNPGLAEEIHVYTRSDSAGAADQWALFAGGMAQSDLIGIGVNGEPGHVDTVRKDPLGLGFSNLNSAFDASTGMVVDGIVVPPIDINANGQVDPGEYYQSKAEAIQVIADGTYPSPPARFENLATKGKPSGLILEFVKWILTDGQQYLEAAGYVPLSAEQRAGSLEKLE